MCLVVNVLSLRSLQTRVRLLTEFITVFQVVDPGLTKWRGKMLYQVYKTRMFICDFKHSKDLIDAEAFRKG